MADQNGAAFMLRTQRRLRVSYETVTYVIDTEDGETTALAGYKRGAGCPISVEIEVEGAWAEWSEDTPTDEDRATLTSHRYLAKTMRAERMLRRNLLLAVLPSLEQAAADVLSNDDGPWESILAELGWWTKTEQAEDAPEGEAVAGELAASTGDTDSPALSPPTPVRTRSR